MFIYKKVNAATRHTIVVTCSELQCGIHLLSPEEFILFLMKKFVPEPNVIPEWLPVFIHPPYSGEWYAVIILHDNVDLDLVRYSVNVI